jgi:Domain of Unknown Function (DUF928)
MKYHYRLWIGAIAILSLMNNAPSLHSLPARRIAFSAPPPPPVSAPDGRSRGGASRGECRNYESLAGIVPTVNGKVWGVTTAEHPTFWFYSPKAIPTASPMVFVLEDANHVPLYTTTLNQEIKAGFIHLSLSDTSPAMVVDQPYFWTLALYCDPEDPGEFVSINGTIARVAIEPAQQTQLQAAPPIERVKWYAEHGIWYDALNAIAEPYEDHPQNAAFAAAWVDLLKYASLESLASQPITHCCKPR